MSPDASLPADSELANSADAAGRLSLLGWEPDFTAAAAGRFGLAEGTKSASMLPSFSSFSSVSTPATAAGTALTAVGFGPVRRFTASSYSLWRAWCKIMPSLTILRTLKHLHCQWALHSLVLLPEPVAVDGQLLWLAWNFSLIVEAPFSKVAGCICHVPWCFFHNIGCLPVLAQSGGTEFIAAQDCFWACCNQSRKPGSRKNQKWMLREL